MGKLTLVTGSEGPCGRIKNRKEKTSNIHYTSTSSFTCHKNVKDPSKFFCLFVCWGFFLFTLRITLEFRELFRRSWKGQFLNMLFFKRLKEKTEITTCSNIKTFCQNHIPVQFLEITYIKNYFSYVLHIKCHIVFNIASYVSIRYGEPVACNCCFIFIVTTP